jgi:hypothetical protein
MPGNGGLRRAYPPYGDLDSQKFFAAFFKKEALAY